MIYVLDASIFNPVAKRTTPIIYERCRIADATLLELFFVRSNHFLLELEHLKTFQVVFAY